MAVMIKAAHNLVVETAIQRRCGIRGNTIVLVRILAAIGTGVVLAFVVGVLNRLSPAEALLMKLFGLSRQNTFPRLAGPAIGLGYIIARRSFSTKWIKGHTNPLELEKINFSMGLSHSFFEDDILLLFVSAQLFWFLAVKFMVAAFQVTAPDYKH